MKNVAIFLSGGTGSRAGSDTPKQYLKAGGHMMATYALKPLLNSDRIDAVVIVAEKEWQESILSDAKSAGLPTEKICAFALPGKNRQLSILNGMTEIEKSVHNLFMVTGTIMVHDAARPFLSVEFLDRIFDALPGHDGVMPVLPMKDTVYYSEDGKSVGKLLEREKIFTGQAPELFVFDKYLKANRDLLPDRILGINGSSEPAIMAGMDIAMISGDEKNIKITTAKDLEKFNEQSFGA